VAVKNEETEMSATASKVMVCGLLLLFTLIFGVWLSHLGKPLNTVIFTIHKLLALATVITIAVSVHDLTRDRGVRASGLVVIAVTGLLFLALFVSGALLSLEETVLQAILRVHQVVPLLALVASMVSIYLLASSKS
jgi:hypothetical protein